MAYCEQCGAELVKRELAHEGMVAYCAQCDAYRFPYSNTAVSMIVLDPTQTKILLIRQYGKADWILVAGYVKADEALEDALHREFHEEIGTCLDQVRYQTSAYYEASNTLMCNFAVVAQEVDLSKCCEWEIDEARWFSFAQAKKAIKPNSLAQRFLFRFLASWEQTRSQL